MSWLLDTCVLSELVKERPEPQVLRWIGSVSEERLYLSALTVGELEKGIALLPDSRRRRRLRAWLSEDLAMRFEGRVLPLDQETALIWGDMQARAEKLGRPLPVIDGLIAATAATYDLTVVTRDIRGMEWSGVRILNPWERQR